MSWAEFGTFVRVGRDYRLVFIRELIEGFLTVIVDLGWSFWHFGSIGMAFVRHYALSDVKYVVGSGGTASVVRRSIPSPVF